MAYREVVKAPPKWKSGTPQEVLDRRVTLGPVEVGNHQTMRKYRVYLDGEEIGTVERVRVEHSNRRERIRVDIRYAYMWHGRKKFGTGRPLERYRRIDAIADVLDYHRRA